MSLLSRDSSSCLTASAPAALLFAAVLAAALRCALAARSSSSSLRSFTTSWARSCLCSASDPPTDPVDSAVRRLADPARNEPCVDLLSVFRNEPASGTPLVVAWDCCRCEVKSDVWDDERALRCEGCSSAGAAGLAALRYLLADAMLPCPTDRAVPESSLIDAYPPTDAAGVRASPSTDVYPTDACPGVRADPGSSAMDMYPTDVERPWVYPAGVATPPSYPVDATGV
mmetsp:Transcript_14754/g.36115  ORF Transcript_14754/g.36115 Transcript_14754/m.36115 type:complete len:228 (-) Transcript_14754:307-990(-)